MPPPTIFPPRLFAANLPAARLLGLSRFYAQTHASAGSPHPPTQTQPQPLSCRGFSTTPRPAYRQPDIPNSDIPIPSRRAPAPEIPPYPLGPHLHYKQSNAGLYGTQRIRYGNNVSKKHGVRTRRRWRPNVLQKRLWSVSLGVFVRTRVTARVLRCVDKAGGLDEYLLGHKSARLRELGPWGWRLRWRVMQTPAVRERFARERAELGLVAADGGEDGAGAGVSVGDVPIELLAEEGIASAEQLLEETERMLRNEEEFEIGGEEEHTLQNKDSREAR